jgi:hypothetical protein
MNNLIAWSSLAGKMRERLDSKSPQTGKTGVESFQILKDSWENPCFYGIKQTLHQTGE